MPENQVIIFDTTLRDGGQCRGRSLTVQEKLLIAKHLAELNVDVIEAGFPGTNEEDAESLQAIAQVIRGTVIAALARANDQDIEAAARALESADSARIHVYIPTGNSKNANSESFREKILEQTRIGIETAKKYCSDVEFSPHNATRIEESFLTEIVQEAVNAGAHTINISDSLGYALPDEFGLLIQNLRQNVEGIDNTVLSVHCHNDLGMAVANSISAIQAGARQVECTVNGIGDRAGNAAMEEIVMALRVHKDKLNVDCNIDTRFFKSASETVSRVTGYTLAPNKAIVGEQALDHKTGAQGSGLEENPPHDLIQSKDISSCNP